MSKLKAGNEETQASELSSFDVMNECVTHFNENAHIEASTYLDIYKARMAEGETLPEALAVIDAAFHAGVGKLKTLDDCLEGYDSFVELDLDQPTTELTY